MSYHYKGALVVRNFGVDTGWSIYLNGTVVAARSFDDALSLVRFLSR